MLVRLYDLPSCARDRDRLAEQGIVCRRAESYERSAVLSFVRANWPNWEDEAVVALSCAPPALYIADEGGEVVGFAAYNATRPNFFGPTAVRESHRGRGIGTVLLIQCLEALAAEGYAYAIIGGIGPAAFYERAVGATVIEPQGPGIYSNHARLPHD